MPLAWPQIAVTGSTLNNGTPLVVCGALLAWLLLGERLQAYHLLGACLVLPGIWLATRKPG